MTTTPTIETPISISDRLEKLYRLRTELAEHKAATWEKVAQLLMEQNQEHAVAINEQRRLSGELSAKIDHDISRMEAFITQTESTLRRALAVLDGTSTEDKTEVREQLAKLLQQ